VSLRRLRLPSGNLTAEQKSASGIVSGNGEGLNEKEWRSLSRGGGILLASKKGPLGS